MDKITKLAKEIAILQHQMKVAEKQCDENYQKIAELYKEFYDNKDSKEFVLYDKYPNIEYLEIYLSRLSPIFHLYEYGTLNAKELAEIIKHIYKFKTGQECDILTIGVTEHYYEENDKLLFRPHLYFMIGNDKKLEPYTQYNGEYVNEPKLHEHIKKYAFRQGIINIDLDMYRYLYNRNYGQGFINIDDCFYRHACKYGAPRVLWESLKEEDNCNFMKIKCMTGTGDSPAKINVYNNFSRFNEIYGVGLEKQIFSEHIIYNLEHTKAKGIKDVFDFKIHPFDTYISKVLISIIIYKRNNNIQKLSNKDYNHIFDVLFGEKVDIIGDSKVDIPKKLIYIPNKNIGR